MKKFISICLFTMLVFAMVGCGKKSGYELALVTDLGTIDDKSFNQGSWEGVEQYAKENDITHISTCRKNNRRISKYH